MTEQLKLQLEFQESPVADEVSAITAVTRPILTGILLGLKGEVVAEVGGLDNVKLFMLPRLRRPGHGDTGVCFEYAVHDALNNRNGMILDRVSSALAQCKVPGSDVSSILFGAEKSGASSIIATAKTLLTEDSVLLYGAQGRPGKLKRHVEAVAKAFRSTTARQLLPGSFSGLWKADLFTGRRDTDRWVGTTLKINRDHLEGAKGLRLGIVPAKQGEKDSIEYDDARNLVICPLPYDRSFMQIFYEGWEVMMAFLAADAHLPAEVALPRPPARQVARYLADRREFSVRKVIEALLPLAQPELLRTKEEQAAQSAVTGAATITTTTSLMAPMPQVR